jgi:hypothetical protein
MSIRSMRRNIHWGDIKQVYIMKMDPWKMPTEGTFFTWAQGNVHLGDIKQFYIMKTHPRKCPLRGHFTHGLGEMSTVGAFLEMLTVGAFLTRSRGNVHRGNVSTMSTEGAFSCRIFWKCPRRAHLNKSGEWSLGWPQERICVNRHRGKVNWRHIF